MLPFMLILPTIPQRWKWLSMFVDFWDRSLQLNLKCVTKCPTEKHMFKESLPVLAKSSSEKRTVEHALTDTWSMFLKYLEFLLHINQFLVGDFN